MPAAPVNTHALFDTLSHRITWLPKACRNAAVRQQVAEAVIKAICGVTASETTPDKVVVRARSAPQHAIDATQRHNTQASARARTPSLSQKATP